VLWPDTFTNYFHPEIGCAAIEVLEALGYAVAVPAGHVCCGRPLYDFGLLDSAKRYLENVLSALHRPIADGLPIVVLEPSCFAVFRDEAVNLLPDRADVKALSRQVVLFDEFIRPQVEHGRFQKIDHAALVHGHCHQKALTGMDHTACVLAALGVKATMLDAGCCGMAGAFGFDADHYDVSIQVGERVLLPAVRGAPGDMLLVADGFSCREQIVQATGRKASHLAEIVRLAIAPTAVT
jgi:Fe-S oxidoreductase